ncbi:MAG: hypothetical protein Q8K51_10055, partial [Nitrospirota bacterium]|nr:hypothetical protein [Nitrospirota bacterium]
PPPDNEMQIIGHSDYGATFLKLETIGNEKRNRSLRSRRISLNWKVEKVSLLIQLISMSITNVVSALKIANGSNPATNKFVRPTEDDDFKKPWMYSPGVTVCSLDFVIDESKAIPATRKELLDKLKEAG